MSDKRVKGYPFDEVRQKEELILKTYEYDLPFNYPNVTVWRKDYDGGEFHGIELLTQNAAPSVTRLGEVVPGEWTLMRGIYSAPPETATAEFRLDVAGMEPGETLCIADAFAGVVPEDWNGCGDIPVGVDNLIANPTFTGGRTPPAGWKMDVDELAGMSSEPKDSEGHTGVRLQEARISLYTEIPACMGQKLVYSLWVKSTNPNPKTVWLYPKWKNKDGLSLSENAGDCIIVEEDDPIVRVAVIGSACTPPGYVMLEAEPCEEFYRRGDMVRCTAPVRFKQGNLWGMHLRVDQWSTRVKADFGYEEIPAEMARRYPGVEHWQVKGHYQEHPLAGMSCAIFEIPKSRKVIITGGSDTPGWRVDNFPHDDHYSFRTIRITVAHGGKK